MSASLILIAGSLAWLILWSALAIRLGATHDKYLKDMSQHAQGGDLAAFWSAMDAYKQRTFAHAHTTSFAGTGIAVGLLMHAGLIGFGETIQWILAAGLLLGVALAGIGVRIRRAPLAGSGSMLFLAGAIASLAGLFA